MLKTQTTMGGGDSVGYDTTNRLGVHAYHQPAIEMVPSNLQLIFASSGPTDRSEINGTVSNGHHGIRRAIQRDISQRDILQALAHDTQEYYTDEDDPSSTRIKWTHDGVVVITDKTGTVLITTYRVGEESDARIVDSCAAIPSMGAYLLTSRCHFGSGPVDLSTNWFTSVELQVVSVTDTYTLSSRCPESGECGPWGLPTNSFRMHLDCLGHKTINRIYFTSHGGEKMKAQKVSQNGTDQKKDFFDLERPTAFQSGTHLKMEMVGCASGATICLITYPSSIGETTEAFLIDKSTDPRMALPEYWCGGADHSGVTFCNRGGGRIVMLSKFSVVHGDNQVVDVLQTGHSSEPTIQGKTARLQSPAPSQDTVKMLKNIDDRCSAVERYLKRFWNSCDR